jgi:hypothetical protein
MKNKNLIIGSSIALGVFAVWCLIKNKKNEPMSPFNGSITLKKITPSIPQLDIENSALGDLIVNYIGEVKRAKNIKTVSLISGKFILEMKKINHEALGKQISKLTESIFSGDSSNIPYKSFSVNLYRLGYNSISSIISDYIRLSLDNKSVIGLYYYIKAAPSFKSNLIQLGY